MTQIIDFSEYLRQPMAAGRAVKLHDGRIGLIETVATNEIGGVTAERGYVVGVAKEFAAWVTQGEIAVVYGLVEKAAVSASRTPAPIA